VAQAAEAPVPKTHSWAAQERLNRYFRRQGGEGGGHRPSSETASRGIVSSWVSFVGSVRTSRASSHPSAGATYARGASPSQAVPPPPPPMMGGGFFDGQPAPGVLQQPAPPTAPRVPRPKRLTAASEEALRPATYHYFDRSNTLCGPLPAPELARLFSRGVIHPRTFVWTDSFEGWTEFQWSGACPQLWLQPIGSHVVSESV